MDLNAFPFDLNEEPLFDLNEESLFDLNQELHDLNGEEENFIHRYWSKKILANIGNESLQIEV